MTSSCSDNTSPRGNICINVQDSGYQGHSGTSLRYLSLSQRPTVTHEGILRDHPSLLARVQLELNLSANRDTATDVVAQHTEYWHFDQNPGLEGRSVCGGGHISEALRLTRSEGVKVGDVTSVASIKVDRFGLVNGDGLIM